MKKMLVRGMVAGIVAAFDYHDYPTIDTAGDEI